MVHIVKIDALEHGLRICGRSPLRAIEQHYKLPEADGVVIGMEHIAVVRNGDIERFVTGWESPITGMNKSSGCPGSGGDLHASASMVLPYERRRP